MSVPVSLEIKNPCRPSGIPAIDDESARLIEVTRSSLEAAIRSMTVGSTLGAIGAAVSEVAEAAGMSIVREYTGHGIGTAMHEEPAVPNYPNGPGHRTKLKSGLVLAVEAAGLGLDTGKHAASLAGGRPGVLHGNMTYILQN